jgi:hypothetical protein
MLTKLVVVAVLAFILEVAHDSHTLALVSFDKLTGAIIAASCPFVGFLDAHWFIEAKTVRARLALATATAIGYAAGTVCVMRWVQ